MTSTRPADQAGRNPSAAAKPLLQTRHFSSIDLMIVAQQVQEAVQSQDPDFNADRVALDARLPPSHAAGNGQIAEEIRVRQGFGGQARGLR
jgi:hypothetical protein